MIDFWLGLHHPGWLKRTDVPAMVSHRALGHSLPRALGPWFQDSSGFSELGRPLGCYETSPAAYAGATRRRFDEMGNLRFAAIQDWMCEPQVLANTGLSVSEHQRRTIESWLDLTELDPELPWIPVLQGWERDDYFRHIDQWLARGIDVLKAQLVGVGTVCKRQSTVWAARLFRDLAAVGIRAHGFGLKITCIFRAREWIPSADSMSWSADGRAPQGGRCSRLKRSHRSCANCLQYALLWRARLIDRLSQLWLPAWADTSVVRSD